ncbi:cation-translocating P-type ATPase [bacterium]|nr:MAG: cation-translocating P-type ATPase [bacterium]
MTTFFSKPAQAVFEELSSSPEGLETSEAKSRLLKYGSNLLQEPVRVSPLSLLLSQFKNVLIIILLIATVLSAFLGHGLEAAAILVIVLFAVLLGFYQELKSERAIEALRKMTAPTARVLRDKREVQLPSAELVPGDVMVLAAGDRVPADGRLFLAVHMRTEEAPLTGESTPVGKDASLVLPEKVPTGDRANMVFAGTTVSSGRARAVVTATGMETEFGKIAGMLQSIAPEATPLQKSLEKIGHGLAKAAIVIVALIVVLGLFRGQPFVEMLIFGIALAVAVVPEALPAVVTISLALGVQRMSRRNALMRNLHAVETLGSTTVICTDKTGTLTKGEMTVREIYLEGEPVEVTGAGYDPRGEFRGNAGNGGAPASLPELLSASVLCNDATLFLSEREEWAITGDPTEGALIVAARKAGLDETEIAEKNPRIGEIPFSSETKMMATLHATLSGKRIFIKGAPEVVIPVCSFEKTGGGVVPLDQAGRERILFVAREMASRALRVLAFCEKESESLSGLPEGGVFLGLAGMLDPPREEAKAAVETCKNAGIRPVMITGDHPKTAEAIARELGILQDGGIVTGKELDLMSVEGLASRIDSIDVYARVSPEHKLRIVEAFRARGEVVAMTGDGVNDAPALKRADIGISMGKSGTDVTREASAMTLADDSFASIVSAVEEGRIIYDNIKKYLKYLISSNVGEIGLIAGAALIGLPQPLTAVQILYVNLATDGLPALALAVDPPEKGLMLRRPRNSKEGIFSKPLALLMMEGGLWSMMANIALFGWALRSGRPLDEAMTMTFVSLVLIQFFKAYSFRSEHESVFRNTLANRWLNLSVAWELALLAAIVYLPAFHKPFGTFSLTAIDFAEAALCSLTIVPVLELTKFMLRRRET